jgi:hypothetical protein
MHLELRCPAPFAMGSASVIAWSWAMEIAVTLSAHCSDLSAGPLVRLPSKTLRDRGHTGIAAQCQDRT